MYSLLPQCLLSEALIQAEFYHHCRLLEVPCTLEWQVAVGRLDAIIFDRTWTRCHAIVEVKKRGDQFKTRQIARYKKIGVPVYGLASFARAPILAAQMKRQFPEGFIGGRAVKDILAMPTNDYTFRGRLRQEFSPLNLDECMNYRDN